MLRLPFLYYQPMQKMKWTSYNAQQAKLTERADIERTKKHVWYCELIMSACLGASAVLLFILIHQILFN